MTVLRSVLFNVLFFGYTTLIALWLLPQLLARDGNVAPGIQHWVSGVLWLLEHVVGITYELRGAENIPTGPAIVASKHQSAWETLLFHRCVRLPAYVMKQELMGIPLYGTYTRMSGSIVVDRKGGARALKNLVRDCRAALEANRQIIIFPEGTRSTVSSASQWCRWRSIRGSIGGGAASSSTRAASSSSSGRRFPRASTANSSSPPSKRASSRRAPP